MLGGDLTLMDEIQRRHAQVVGTAEEQVLLVGQLTQQHTSGCARAALHYGAAAPDASSSGSNCGKQE